MAVTVLAIAQVTTALRYEPKPSSATERHGLAGVPGWLAQDAPEPPERTVEPYTGYGTWVDLYDLLPGAGASGGAAFTVDAVDDMAGHGVRTLYLQAARPDDGAPRLADPVRLGQVLVRAHQEGMRVVGWYLPTFSDLDRDLDHLRAIAAFEVLGHRFDGVAVDIEATDAVPDPAERSDRLVELSERLRAGLGDQALGAIVLPPVQLEVVNPGKWPAFPWSRLADLYDVWLPMGYWTVRSPESGYDDSAVYTEENLRRLRRDLDDPDAAVHPIGGIGDGVSAGPAAAFARAAEGGGAIGASIYDWNTLDRAVHGILAPQVNSWHDH